MQRSHGIIHCVIRRDSRDPGEVRWYVRRVWLHRGATHDRVVAFGDFRAPIGERTAESVVEQALEAALAALRGSSTTE